MGTMKKLFFLLFFFTYHINFAQPNHYGNWFILFTQTQLTDKWSYWGEAQYRNYNVAGDMEQLLLRTAIQYHINPNVFISQGIGYINNMPYVGDTDVKLDQHEVRLYQQAFVKNRFGRFYLNHRYRFEQRWLESGFRLRYRYFVQVNVPVNKPSMEPGALYLSLYNELFIHGDTDNSNAFDRDRVYTGIGRVMGPQFKIELGNMVQLLEGRHRHQFQIVMVKTFDARRNKE